MKKFLIIQLRPEDETAESEFQSLLRRGGLGMHEVERLRLERVPLPHDDFTQYSAIIVGGSPFDLTTPEHEKTSTQKRVEEDFQRLFDDVVARDMPFLGACSGNGLLGRYLGAPISTHYAEPVGGVDITLTKEGLRDDLLRGLPQTFRALVGHKEACDCLPEGATLLASSPTCPIEMFRVGKNVYATQFHPEADAQEFIVRINAYKDYGYFPPEDAKKLIASVATEVAPVPHQILRRFVQTYRA